MFSPSDTIVAIATPPGRGAIGMVRLSGPESQSIACALLKRARPLEPRRATFASLDAGELRDRVVATLFSAPHSYTGDVVVEITGHGSDVVLRAIVRGAMAAGARLAGPGEFTLRAYLNGKVDLAQAEAIADLIDAVTPLQARSAFDQLNGTLASAIAPIEAELFDLIARLEASVDFPDEGYHFIEPDAVSRSIAAVVARVDALLASARRGRLVREGAHVTIAGVPNAGKSSLFNALVGAHRAIVTDVPGTTRDLLTETVDLGGVRVTLVDTAGLTESDDPVEREGIARAKESLAHADCVLLVRDGSRPLVPGTEKAIAGFDARSIGADEARTIVVASKADLPPAWTMPDAVRVSSLTGAGLDTLVARIVAALNGGEPLRDVPPISNVRHIDLLERTRGALSEAASAVAASGGALSEEFVLADLQQAGLLLQEITGRRTADDLLAHVFERFCVGK
jgi:tRNA modification GTPase